MAKIHWANLYAEGPEDIVPDGVVDWAALFRPLELPSEEAREDGAAASGNREGADEWVS